MSYSSEMIYFSKRASEERTAALQEPNSAARKEHRREAERCEERVRDIAMRVRDTRAQAIAPAEQGRIPEW